MGMGEPFHNEEAVYEADDHRSPALALELYPSPPASSILISTVGIPDAMVRCARRVSQR